MEMKQTVDRCVLRWEPDTYYWLAPGDRDEWLEVGRELFDDAADDPEGMAASLRKTLDGELLPEGRGTTYPMRAVRRWLQLQGEIRDGVTFDVVGG